MSSSGSASWYSRVARVCARASAVLVIALSVSCQDDGDAAELKAFRERAALAAANKQVVLNWYKAIDEGRLDAAAGFFHPDLKWHAPSNSPHPTISATVGQMLEAVFADFPKWNHRIDDIFAVDDKVVVRSVDIATPSPELSAATGATGDVSFSVLVIFRLQDGKIVEVREDNDAVGLMRQLGREPQPIGN